MSKTRGGFTIIEVVLFVGLSGFLIIGLMVGTSATVARQRYNDSAQDLAEYFRREYSAVTNAENGRTDLVDKNICSSSEDGSNPVGGTIDDSDGANRGRSACLLYGRLITIGEFDNDDKLYSYDVIGKELSANEALQNPDLKSALAKAEISVIVRINPSGSATCDYQPIGEYQYSPQWLAKVEKTSAARERLRATVLIVRSPANGSIHTLVYDGAIKVQDSIASSCTSGAANSLLNEEAIKKFQYSIVPDNNDRGIEMCVGSDDIFAVGGSRRGISIIRDGHNGTAVDLLDQDSEANPCQQ